MKRVVEPGHIVGVRELSVDQSMAVSVENLTGCRIGLSMKGAMLRVELETDDELPKRTSRRKT